MFGLTFHEPAGPQQAEAPEQRSWAIIAKNAPQNQALWRPQMHAKMRTALSRR